jgi:hypothetical protein
MNWRLYDASFSNFDAGKERSNQVIDKNYFLD